MNDFDDFLDWQAMSDEAWGIERENNKEALAFQKMLFDMFQDFRGYEKNMEAVQRLLYDMQQVNGPPKAPKVDKYLTGLDRVRPFFKWQEIVYKTSGTRITWGEIGNLVGYNRDYVRKQLYREYLDES